MPYDARGNNKIYPDPVLTNISIGWESPIELVADRIMPPVRVNTQGGRYYDFGLKAFHVPVAGSLRAPGTEANEITGITTSQDKYFCDEHSLQTAVPDEEEIVYRGTQDINPLRDGTELVTMQLALEREVAVRDIVLNSSNYPSDHVRTGHASTSDSSNFVYWDDFDDSDPIEDIRVVQRTIHKKLLRPANTAIIPFEVMSKIEDHPAFLNRIAHTERGIITAELVASVLGIETIYVPGSAYNPTANPPQQPVEDPGDLSYIWGNDIWIGWVPPRPGRRMPAFGYQFFWTGLYGGREQQVDRWYEINRKSTVIRVSRAYDHKITAKDSNGKAIAGYLLKNVTTPAQ